MSESSEPYRKPSPVPPVVLESPLDGFKKVEADLAFLRAYRQDLARCVGDASKLNKLKEQVNNFLFTRCDENCRKEGSDYRKASQWLQALTLDELEVFRDPTLSPQPVALVRSSPEELEVKIGRVWTAGTLGLVMVIVVELLHWILR
ncbi:MAG: hypothetical protein ACYDH4_09515 [Candidatus Cryosericum sp.]